MNNRKCGYWERVGGPKTGHKKTCGRPATHFANPYPYGGNNPYCKKHMLVMVVDANQINDRAESIFN